MTPFSASIAFAILVSITNWNYMRTVVLERSTSSIHISGSAFVILFSIFAIFFIGRSLMRLVRKLLSQGPVVPKDTRLFDWRPCLFLFPLLFQISGGMTEVATNGQTITKKWGYGSDASIYALIFSSMVIVVFQVHANLSNFDTKKINANKTSSDEPASLWC
jgi:hypothetical protein